MELYRAYTHHPTVLCRLENGEIGHRPPNADRTRFPEIVICVAGPGSVEAVLFANCAAEQPVTLRHTTWSAPLFPMRRLVVQREPWCALAHPYSGLLLAALPEVAENGDSHCAVTRWREPDGWETYRLEAVTADQLRCPERAQAAAALLARGAEAGWPSLLSDPDTLEAAARLRPQREFERLAGDVMADPALADSVLAAVGDDPFAVGLRNLLATRPGHPAAAVDRRNDDRFVGIGRPSSEGTYASFAHKLTSTARRQRVPGRKLCALATARDEGPYLLEWMAYHRLLGVEHFFIATNANADGSDALLRALDHHGILTWTPNAGEAANPQAKAYGHALTIEPAILDYEWAAILDLDEFITLKPGVFGSVPDYLAWQANQPVDVIALCWAVYWSNNNVRWSPEPSLARFARQNERSGLFKSLVRPGLFTYAYPHHPVANDPSRPVQVRDAAGTAIAFGRGELTNDGAAPLVYGPAWVNHYFARSAEEFVWKWSRNRGTEQQVTPFAAVPEMLMARFVEMHGHAGLDVEDAVTARLPAVRAEMERLCSLPGVATAQAAILSHRRAQAGRTLEFVAGIDRAGLGPHHRAFLDLLVAGLASGP